MMVTGHGVKARGFLALERAIAVDEFGEDMVRKKFEVASRMRCGESFGDTVITVNVVQKAPYIMAITTPMN